MGDLEKATRKRKRQTKAPSYIQQLTPVWNVFCVLLLCAYNLLGNSMY